MRIELGSLGGLTKGCPAKDQANGIGLAISKPFQTCTVKCLEYRSGKYLPADMRQLPFQDVLR